MTRCTSVAGRPLSRGSSEPSAVYYAMVVSLRKSADFVFHQKEPPNGSPPLCRLVEEFVTPEPDFFLRTHGDIPELDPSTYRLTVAGMLSKKYEFSLNELSKLFSSKEVAATVQCAGNRRCSASAVKTVQNEVAWGNDAISNAVWTGCSLADLLHFIGCVGQRNMLNLSDQTPARKKERRRNLAGRSHSRARLLAMCYSLGA